MSLIAVDAVRVPRGYSGTEMLFPEIFSPLRQHQDRTIPCKKPMHHCILCMRCFYSGNIAALSAILACTVASLVACGEAPIPRKRNETETNPRVHQPSHPVAEPGEPSSSTSRRQGRSSVGRVDLTTQPHSSGCSWPGQPVQVAFPPAANQSGRTAVCRCSRISMPCRGAS